MSHGDDTTRQVHTGEVPVAAQFLHELKRDLRDGFREIGTRLLGIETRLGEMEKSQAVEKHKIDEALVQIVDLEKDVKALALKVALVEATGPDKRREPHWAMRALVIAILNVIGGAGALWILHGLASAQIGVHP